MLGCTGKFPPPARAADAHSTPGSFPAEQASLTELLPVDEPRDVYLHGHVTSRLMKLPADDGADEGTPMTLCATLMDGIVMALTPFHHSCNYRSAVVQGYASIVTDEAEKLYAMERITNNIAPRRWENSRVPPTKTELQSTGILRVRIESASAKIRVGGPGDDRPDLKDPNVIGNVWTGVVPASIQYGEPQASDYNQVKNVPGYVNEWIKKANHVGNDYALKAIKAKK